MKVTILSYNAVASWKWDTSSEPHKIHHFSSNTSDLLAGEAEDSDDEDEDDVCGICMLAFESCCPGCKVPGDDCPLSEYPFQPRGYSADMDSCSMGRMYTCVSYALSFKMDRYGEFKTAMSNGSSAMG
jgi:hypothetical protein